MNLTKITKLLILKFNRLFIDYNMVPILLLLFVFALIPSCKSSSSEPVIKRPLAVRIIAVKTGFIKETIKYVGTVHSQNEIKILSRVAGKIYDLPVAEGMTAKTQDPLAQITAPEMDARVSRLKAEVIRAKGESAFLCQQSKLDQELSKSDTISKIKYDASLQKCNSSKSAVKVARAGLKEIKYLAKNTVERAPFNGKVLQWLTKPGENTMPGKPILLFGDELLEVRVKVHEKDIGEGMQENTSVIMVLSNNNTVRGVVNSVAPMAIGPGRMIEVSIDIDQKHVTKVHHGMSIDVNFIINEQLKATLVPVNSLLKNKNELGVYVVRDDKAHWLSVKSSIEENGWVAVESIKVGANFKTGDYVVVGNLELVKDGGPVYSVDFDRSTQ